MTIWRLDDAWTGDDKLAHGFGATALLLVLSRHLPIGSAVAVVALAAVGVEVIELWRYRAWMARGGAGRWPPLTDLMSPKDLAWDAAGILAGVLLR